VKTTREFHQRLLSEPAFLSGEISTRYIKDTMYAGHPMQRLL
jgi:acetyl-CoA carboxylase biotin carboxylase subunit